MFAIPHWERRGGTPSVNAHGAVRTSAGDVEDRHDVV